MVVVRTPIPSPVTGYALAPGIGSGLFSLVLPSRNNLEVNLNDIGCEVVAYRGGGLPQVRNLYNRSATTSKTQYIKTLVDEQTLELTITVVTDSFVGEDSLTALQRVVSSLALYLGPSESRQSAAELYIRYQSRGDDCQTKGVALQRRYKYVGGLDDYNVDNRNQLLLNLRFESFEGSKWEETTENEVGFGASSVNTDKLITMNLSTGAVATASGTYATIDLPQRVFKDSTGGLWSGGSVTGGTSSIKGAVNYAGAETGGGYVGSFAEFIPGAGNPNRIYAAKVSPDTSTTYLLRLDAGGVAWANVAGVNNSIYDLAATASGSEVIVVGNFTTPSNRIAKIDTSGSLDAMSSINANAVVYSASHVNASKFVVAGAFTTIGVTTVGRIAIVDIATETLVSTLGGGLSETIYAVKALPNGDIYALAQSTIYYWNGAKWAATDILGPNTAATNTISTTNNVIGYDKTTGALYFCINSNPVSYETYQVRRVLKGVMGAPVGVWNSNSTGLLLIKTAVVYDGVVYISGSGVSYLVKNAPTAITYAGTTDQKSLTFEFTLSDTNAVAGVVTNANQNKTSIFFQVKNWSTRKVIMVDLPQGILRPGQNLLLKLNQNGKPVSFYTPDANGGIQEDFTRYLVPGSDVDSFALVRGTNYVEVWGNGAAIPLFDSATLTYQNAHYGADGSVNQTVVAIS